MRRPGVMIAMMRRTAMVRSARVRTVVWRAGVMRRTCMMIAVVRPVMRRTSVMIAVVRPVMWRPVRTAMSLLVVVIVPVVVIIAVVAVPLALLFAFDCTFALSLGLIVVVCVVIIVVRVVVPVVVVHRERGGHEGIEVSFFFDHFVVSESAGRVPVEVRSFIRRRSARGRARRAKLAQLLTAQGAVAIAIEFAKGRWRCVDLRGAERTVVIGIEQAQQSARRTGAAGKAGTAWRPLAAGSATIRAWWPAIACFGAATSTALACAVGSIGRFVGRFIAVGRCHGVQPRRP
jgi:hypothetical protein